MWKLPDGRIIKNPRQGKTFTIGGINHNETHLLKWDDATLVQHGVKKVVEVGYDSLLYKCTGYTEEIIGNTVIRRPITVENTESMERMRADKLLMINRDVNQYILEAYDIGTQMSLQAIHAMPEADAAIKIQLESLFAWIRSILQYYYTKKATIQEAPTLGDLDMITWDFETFTDTDPNVSLMATLEYLDMNTPAGGA